MKRLLCPECRKEVRDKQEFCPHCGADLIMLGKIEVSDEELERYTPLPLHYYVVHLSRVGLEPRFYEISDFQGLVIGRQEGDIVIKEDHALSPKHAVLKLKEGKVLLDPLTSLNKVFLRIKEDYELKDEDVFILGDNIFRFNVLPMISD